MAATTKQLRHRLPEGMADPARPAKRAKLDPDAQAALATRACSEDTALEVGVMILDYFGYQVTATCLSLAANQSLSRMNAGGNLPGFMKHTHMSLERNLSLFDTFYKLFTTAHPAYELDAEMRFRLLLCKLVVLVVGRWAGGQAMPRGAALEGLRISNQERARNWIGTPERVPSAAFIDSTAFDESLPISQEELNRNTSHVLQTLGLATESRRNGIPSHSMVSFMSTLDVLPLFMQVSAARNAMSGSNVTQPWMQLAGEFMLQAALEQYLICGAQGTDAVDEAFAWGYRDDVREDIDTIDRTAIFQAKAAKEINIMFEDEVYEAEVEGWNDIKNDFLKQLSPLETQDGGGSCSGSKAHGEDDSQRTEMIARLQLAAAGHPIAEFEAKLCTFLGALASSIQEPVLVQLEKGELDGMSQQETQDFLRDCRLDPELFLNGIEFHQREEA